MYANENGRQLTIRAGTARTPAMPHVTSYEGCGLYKVNGICRVVRLTVALDRTLVTVEYEEKRKSQCAGSDKCCPVSCRNYRRTFKCRLYRPSPRNARRGSSSYSTRPDYAALREEKERRESSLLTCNSRKLCINVLSIFDHSEQSEVPTRALIELVWLPV